MECSREGVACEGWAAGRCDVTDFHSQAPSLAAAYLR
jgi:hypothetical protein